MSKKRGNFFEEHIEKIVMAVVGLVCLWFFITRILISPNCIEYDNHKFGPGDIDNYINKEAGVLEHRLNRKPESKQPYKLRVSDFIALLDSAIPDIDVSLSLPLPPNLEDVIVKGKYRIPLVGQVNDIEIEHIKAVAYVPNEEISEENVYGPDVSEPNDIDLVTVEAKFDVAGLYERFYESFVGESVQEEWRDPCLAVPTFAAVQLQRQELLSDGGWSDWQIIPRTKIEHRKRMFEVIEDVDDLPAGGIKIRLYQFKDREAAMDLLQPEAYRIASAKEEWFPPLLHKEYVKYQREIDEQERREARAAEKEEREREREEGRSERRSRTPKTRERVTELSGGGMGRGMGGTSIGKTPTRKRRSEREREIEKERPERGKEILKTVSDVYKEFDEILITEKTNIAKMNKPLMFWAHDDTVEPEKGYRYRIRLGVFNPIAGTNQFSEQDKSLKNKVVLWSEFSEVTETVNIPGTLYFFPREIQEASKLVTVTVCRYVLGYWYSKDFMVRQGEVIGKVVKSKSVEEQEEVTVPETIDYATGAVLLDVIPVNDWSGGKNLRARHYFDMLYSFEGTDIKRMPIKSKYWAEEFQIKFNEIKRAEKEPKEALRDWGSRTGRRRRVPRPGLDEGMLRGYDPTGYYY